MDILYYFVYNFDFWKNNYFFFFGVLSKFNVVNFFFLQQVFGKGYVWNFERLFCKCIFVDKFDGWIILVMEFCIIEDSFFWII